jgi:hypothetical protein
MRLVGTVAVRVAGSVVTREPSLWEKMKSRLGGTVDLTTDRVRSELEATAVVEQIRRALGRLAVDNALSLVVDDQVVFQDSEGRGGDLPDLVLALTEHVQVFGRGFRELRFATEHEEAGLHLVIESRARTEHASDEPAALISVGGRMRALEPRPGEAPEAYQQRVAPLTRDTVAFETARMQFESFLSRLEDALRAAMPEARVEQVRAEARLVAPPSDRVAPPPPQVREPLHPAYDPFLLYYPSPMGMMLDAMIMSSLLGAMAPSPHITVVNPAGNFLGSVEDVAAQPDLLTSDAAADDVSGADDGGDPADDGGLDDDAGALDDGGGGLDDSGGGLDDGGGGLDDGGGGFDDGGGGFDDGGGGFSND